MVQSWTRKQKDYVCLPECVTFHSCSPFIDLTVWGKQLNNLWWSDFALALVYKSHSDSGKSSPHQSHCEIGRGLTSYIYGALGATTTASWSANQCLTFNTMELTCHGGISNLGGNLHILWKPANWENMSLMEVLPPRIYVLCHAPTHFSLLSKQTGFGSIEW